MAIISGSNGSVGQMGGTTSIQASFVNLPTKVKLDVYYDIADVNTCFNQYLLNLKTNAILKLKNNTSELIWLEKISFRFANSDKYFIEIGRDGIKQMGNFGLFPPFISSKKQVDLNLSLANIIEKNENVFSQIAATQNVYVDLTFQDELRTITAVEKVIIEDFSVAFVNPTLIDIEVVNVTQRDFYANNDIDVRGVDVQGLYRYDVSQRTRQIGLPSYVTTLPSNLPPQNNKEEQRQVIVSYGGFSTTFDINIHCVEKVVVNNYKKDRYFREVCEETLYATIFYTDGTNEVVDVDNKFITNKAGQYTYTAEIISPKTKENVTANYVYNVYNVSDVNLAITNEFKDTYFTFDEVVYDGLIFTAIYQKGQENEFSRQLDISIFSIQKADMSTIGNKEVTFIYEENGVMFTKQAPITVNGLAEIVVDSSLVEKRLVKAEREFGLDDIKNLKVYANYSQEDELVEIKTYNIDTSTIDLNSLGQQYISVSHTYHGVTKTANIYFTVFSLSFLEVEGGKKTFYKTGENKPLFSKGNLVVFANYTDGTIERIENYSISVSEKQPLDLGIKEVVVEYTKGDTKTATYEIEVKNDYVAQITKVDTTSLKKTYKHLEKFNSAGIYISGVTASELPADQVSFTTNYDEHIFDDSKENAGTKILNIYPEGGAENELGTFTADIYFDVVEKIEIVNPKAIKSVYKINEIIDFSKLEVKLTFSSGETQIIGSDDIQYSEIDSSKVGTKTIIVSANKFTSKTTSISVDYVDIEDFVLVQNNNTKYNRTDKLEKEALTFSVVYTNSLIVEDIKGTDARIVYSIKNGNVNYLVADSKNTSITTVTASIKNVSTTFEIEVKELREVKVVNEDGTELTKLSLHYGQIYTSNGKQFIVQFNNGEFISGLISNSQQYAVTNKISNLSFAYTYKEETMVSNQWTIHCVSLDNIAADAIFKNEYFIGDSFAFESLKVSKQYRTTDETEGENGLLPPVNVDLDESGLNITPQIDSILLTSGERIAKIVYKDEFGQSASASYGFEVKEVVLLSISAVFSNEFKSLSSYIERERLDLEGLTIKTHYNKESLTQEVDIVQCSIYFGTKEVSPTQYIDYTYDGEMVKVSYNNIFVELGILEVAEDELKKIEIAEESSFKTNYLIGDFFSKDKLFVKAFYKSGYIELISSEQLVTSLDGSQMFNKNDVGTKTFEISFTKDFVTKTTVGNITISNPKIKSLILDTSLLNLSPTNNTAYNINGLKAKIMFENGYIEVVENLTTNVKEQLNLDSSNVIQCTNNLGSKTITVEVENPYISGDKVTSTFTISVLPNTQLKNIYLQFKEEEKPFEYRVGDVFDAKGLIVVGEFQDQENTNVVEGWTTYPKLGSVIRSGGRKTITVSYEYLGVLKQETYEISVLMNFESGLIKTSNYKIAFNVDEVVREEVVLNEKELGYKLYPLYDSNILDMEDDIASEYYGKNVLKDLSVKDSACVGYVNLGDEGRENGHIIFFEDVTNPISGDGNITVKFPHFIEGQYEKIAKCTFGTIFNGRLFVSGNSNYKNVDWHSGQVNVSQTTNYGMEREGDYTYFSDLDYCMYGSDDNAVVGYDVFKDGTLIVFKESSLVNPTIYKRVMKYINATDFAGNVFTESELVEEAFPRYDVSKNGGVGALSDKSIVNFNGETLFLTKEGLKRLNSHLVAETQELLIEDVTDKINPKIKQEGLETSVLISHKGQLFLKTDRGIYVANKELRDATDRQYEWYFLGDIEIDSFFSYKDKLYLVNKNGVLARFENNLKDFVDRNRSYIAEGGVSVDELNNLLYVSANRKDAIKEGLILNVMNKKDSIHVALGTFINKDLKEEGEGFDLNDIVGLVDETENCIELLNVSQNEEIYDGREVYADFINGTFYNIEKNKKYILKEVESNLINKRFKLLDSEGQEQNLLGVRQFRLSYKIENLNYCTITNVNELLNGLISFKLLNPKGKEIKVIQYEGLINSTYSAVITSGKNVNCYCITKPYDLGKNLYTKTLWQLNVINDTELPSKTELGYLVSRKQGDFLMNREMNVGAKQFEIDETFSFGKTQFLNDKLPRNYNRNIKERNVVYVRFAFKNNENSNIALSQLDIVFSIEKMI